MLAMLLKANKKLSQSWLLYFVSLTSSITKGKNKMWSQPSCMAYRTFYQATVGVDEIEEVS